MSFYALSYFVATIIFSASTTAQVVEPFPALECGTGIGLFSCPNQPGCCAGGICCAGGCCGLTDWCVNIGLSNEGCCPLSDPDSCGASIASFSTPACTALSPKPSVQCVSADDDWYCPPGSACGSTYPQCFDFFDLGCTSDAPDDPPSPTPTPTPTPGPSSPRSSATASFEDDTVSETTVSGTGTQGLTPVPASSSPGAGTVVERPEMGVIGALALILGLVW